MNSIPVASANSLSFSDISIKTQPINENSALSNPIDFTITLVAQAVLVGTSCYLGVYALNYPAHYLRGETILQASSIAKWTVSIVTANLFLQGAENLSLSFIKDKKKAPLLFRGFEWLKDSLTGSAFTFLGCQLLNGLYGTWNRDLMIQVVPMMKRSVICITANYAVQEIEHIALRIFGDSKAAHCLSQFSKTAQKCVIAYFVFVACQIVNVIPNAWYPHLAVHTPSLVTAAVLATTAADIGEIRETVLAETEKEEKSLLTIGCTVIQSTAVISAVILTVGPIFNVLAGGFCPELIVYVPAYLVYGATLTGIKETVDRTKDIFLALLGAQESINNTLAVNDSFFEKSGRYIRSISWKTVNCLTKIVEVIDDKASYIIGIRSAKTIEQDSILDRNLSQLEIVRKVFVIQLKETVSGLIAHEGAVLVSQAVLGSVCGFAQLAFATIAITAVCQFHLRLDDFNRKVRRERYRQQWTTTQPLIETLKPTSVVNRDVTFSFAQ